ncbi:MAG TPA: nucleotidyltransferase domain-containing protein [Woeseiaceae bacterium]|nr:nucleotidyltransferase domain-containing protein [Woeseiaceae bacterium]
MRFDTPLDDIFLNRSHIRVLRALHGLPIGFAASGRELARRAGVTHPTALKALNSLVEVGIVNARRGIAGDLYEFEVGHALAKPVMGLFEAEGEILLQLRSFLREKLLGFTDKINAATLFGSAARGDSQPGSDIDIAVSCAPEDRRNVEAALENLADAVRERFGNRLSPLIDCGKQKRRSIIRKRINEEGIPLIRHGKGVTE